MSSESEVPRIPITVDDALSYCDDCLAPDLREGWMIQDGETEFEGEMVPLAKLLCEECYQKRTNGSDA